MSELQKIYKTYKKESFVKIIEEKLNVVIEKEDSDFMDFTNATDHDYDLPYVVDSLMYYINPLMPEQTFFPANSPTIKKIMQKVYKKSSQGFSEVKFHL